MSIDENSSNLINLSDNLNNQINSENNVSLPYNLEAEQSLLGAILFDNTSLEKTMDLIKDYHLYEPLHQEIYQACLVLFDNNKLADPTTLKGYLKDQNPKRKIDVSDYLNKLQGGVLSISNVMSYANEIKNCYLRRSLIRISDDLKEQSLNIKIDTLPETLIEKAEESLFNLAEKDKVDNGPQKFQVTLKSATELINQAYKKGTELPGVDTGFKRLNSFLGGLNKSDLIVLAGRPSMGKTALATNIAFKASKSNHENKDPVLFFSLEMSSEQLAQRILAEQSGIDSHRIRRGDINENEFSNIVKTQNLIQETPFYIDDTPALSVSQIASRARRLKRTEGLKLIVIDYIQLIQSKNVRGPEYRVQEVSAITRQLKSIAKELNIPIVALSQLSRAVEQRDDKRPILADLRESGSIEQDADVVMFVYREEYYLEKAQPIQRENENRETFSERFKRWEERCEEAHGKAEIIVSKQRHGPTGNIQIQFQAQFTRFLDLIQNNENTSR
tara:strand:- start:1085 stop:2590 length:1506 start_codon:yes stop_codon:yes gene_type:complete